VKLATSIRHVHDKVVVHLTSEWLSLKERERWLRLFRIFWTFRRLLARHVVCVNRIRQHRRSYKTLAESFQRRRITCLLVRSQGHEPCDHNEQRCRKGMLQRADDHPYDIRPRLFWSWLKIQDLGRRLHPPRSSLHPPRSSLHPCWYEYVACCRWSFGIGLTKGGWSGKDKKQRICGSSMRTRRANSRNASDREGEDECGVQREEGASFTADRSTNGGTLCRDISIKRWGIRK